MALTPEQIQAYRQKYGLDAGVSSAPTDPSQKAAERISTLEASVNTVDYGGVPLQATPAPAAKPLVPQGAKDFGKGLAKGATEALYSASAFNAGPVGQAMLDNAPELKETVETVIKPGMEAANSAEQAGVYTEKAAEFLTGAGAAKAAKNALTYSTDLIAAVSPKLTKKTAESALARGKGTVSKVLGKVDVDFAKDPHVKRLADTVAKYVPDFDPAKPLVENINKTREVVYGLADELKQAIAATGKDVIYPHKQLASHLKAIPKPTLLTRDLEPVYERVQQKMMEIARSNGGKLSDLFQARKEFDEFVDQSFPNLYSSDQLTPMRVAIKDIRRAVNEFIEDNLPKEIGMHDSLTTQSRLFEAIENMAEKAASGAQKEIGTGRVGRFLNKHPKLKDAAKYGLGALIGGGAASAVLKD